MFMQIAHIALSDVIDPVIYGKVIKADFQVVETVVGVGHLMGQVMQHISILPASKTPVHK